MELRNLLPAVLLFFLVTTSVAFESPAFVRHPRTSRAPMRMAAVNPSDDWLSSVALSAEGCLVDDDELTCGERRLAEIYDALNYAVRAHQSLRRKVAAKMAEMRTSTAVWYISDSFDH